MHQLHQIIPLFVDFKSAEMLKEKSIKSYLYHLKTFLRYLPEDSEIKASDIAKFIMAEKKRGLSPATIEDRWHALSVFFNWRANCEELGKPLSPMLGMKPPKHTTIEPRRAKLIDVRRLIRCVPERNWIDARDKAFIQLMLDTGLRLGEVAALIVKDMDLEDRIVFVKYGKGDKSRSLPFTKKTVQFISAYLACRPKSSFNRHMWLSSINEDGEVRGLLTGYGIAFRLKSLCERYKVPHINPHSIRHLFGMKALNDGIRIEVVSAMMGHTSIDFTRKVYAPLLTETTKREYDANWK